MGLAGRNQLLATTDFPTGRSLGKQYFTAAQTAGTESLLGKELVPKKTKLLICHKFTFFFFLVSFSFLCQVLSDRKHV